MSDRQPQITLAEGDADQILYSKNRGFEAYFSKTLKPLFLLPYFVIWLSSRRYSGNFPISGYLLSRQ
ncbi:hypothetical protein BV372_23440 [Nostoc sp. T09]|nr:hypothetical protein BV372_23440 [Nostoc sp. T09]